MSPKRVLGPHDKRKKLTRCQACASRRIKCEGGTPSEANFEFVTPEIAGSSSSALGHVQNETPESATSRFLDCFRDFVSSSHFTKGFQSVDFTSLIQSSIAVRHAAVAIGAQHASRHGPGGGPARQAAHSVASDSYRQSIALLQARLGEEDAAQEDVLWCTFLLGIFELLDDVSGEGWAKHMLFGSSRILAMMGPEKLAVTPLGEVSLELFRILDINKALLYGEETILAQDDWLLQQPPVTGAACRDPLGTILTLMVYAATFNAQCIGSVMHLSAAERALAPVAQQLSYQGAGLREMVRNWRQELVPRLYGNEGTGDPFLKLALAYQHALVIMLAPEFAHYDALNSFMGSSQLSSETQDNIAVIISLVQELLSTSNVPGISLLFPLFIAGANAGAVEHRSSIMALLEQANWKGFVASNCVVHDLTKLWIAQALSY
ncbi:hypothetical protein OQA88_8524 [Cercophora sp. LCS_1]